MQCFVYVADMSKYHNAYMEHVLWYISFYYQKHMAHLMFCSGPQLVRDNPLGRPHLWYTPIGNCILWIRGYISWQKWDMFTEKIIKL